MIALEQYNKIRNNYCLAYFGGSNEYLVQLRLLRPIFEQYFKGLNIYYCCSDDKIKYLRGTDRVLTLSELRERKSEFAHVKEMTYNGQSHPVLDLLEQSGINRFSIPTHTTDHTNICSIVTKGSYPTINLLQTQIRAIQKMSIHNGYEIQINGNWEEAGLVIGVESVDLFEAAARGIKTYLIPSGNGEQLYKKMFPNGNILHI